MPSPIMQSTEFGERGTESIPSHLSQAEEDTQNFWEVSSKGQRKCIVNLQRIFFFRINFQSAQPVAQQRDSSQGKKEKHSTRAGNITTATFLAVNLRII